MKKLSLKELMNIWECSIVTACNRKKQIIKELNLQRNYLIFDDLKRYYYE